MSRPIRDRKTQPTDADVDAYLEAIPDVARRADARAAVGLFREVTGADPRMWGATMIGFGTQQYAAADGKIRESMAVGLAARSAALALYGLTFYGSNAELLGRLGRHTTGKGCLYVKKLADVDLAILRELIERGWATNHHAE